MKIAIIHNQFARGGGMESYMLSLVKGFLQTGDQVDIYAYKIDKTLAAEFPCSVHHIKTPPLPGKWRKFFFIHKLNKLFDPKQYDLSLSLTRSSCQDIAVCGGVHRETIKHIKRSSVFRAIHDHFEIHFEKEMFERVPWIMAHSLNIEQEIKNNYHINQGKIRTLYPPIDTSIFQPTTQDTIIETRKRYGIDENKLSFLFPSCGHQRKGIRPLLQAFAKLDSDKFELLVAGSPIPADSPVNVRHIGYVRNLAPVYSSVDFTILPSDYEPFGLVIPESLQCLTPVITTMNVGSAHLLSEKEGIRMENNLPETILHTLEKLTKNSFTVSSNFASTHGLTIQQHIADIKNISKCQDLKRCE
jgi:glycosyltransferase involved in cell wall biosynthesis